MFIRKTMCPETFKSFSGMITQAIEVDKKDHTVSTILDAIHETIMHPVPIRVRQSAMFCR